VVNHFYNNQNMCSKRNTLNFGFTTIEIIVVIGILGVLISLVIIAVNPVIQLRRTRDLQRASDLKAVQTAIEAYRVANNIYPLSNDNFEISTAPWGSNWSTYMQLPSEPLKNQKYAYVSQFGTEYQLYAKFENLVPNEFSCNGKCGPFGEYNAGLASANSSLASIYLIPTPTPSPTPTPPPAELIQGKVSYFGSSTTYPKIIQVDFDPLDVGVGQTQLVTAKVWSEHPIAQVTAYIELDNSTTETFNLTQTSSTISNQIYRDTWAVSIPHTDTHDTTYTVHLSATDSEEQEIASEIVIR